MKLLIATCVSSSLYHVTSNRAAALILEKMRFELKPSDGNESELRLGNKPSYYLSCARSLTSSYIRQSFGSKHTLFKFSPSFARNHKSAPVDYWESMKDPMMRDGARGRNEMEDRLFTQNSFLKIKPGDIEAIYMTADIDVDKISPSTLNTKWHQHIYAVYRWCRFNKVPIYFIQNGDPYKSLLHRKFIPFVPPKPKDVKVDNSRQNYLLKYRFRKNDLIPWLKLYYWPVKNRYKQLNQIGRAAEHLQYSDAVEMLKSDMHNAKNDPFDDPTRYRESLQTYIHTEKRKNGCRAICGIP